jgi:hypothetical protein
MWTNTSRIGTIRMIIQSRHHRTTATTTGSHLAEAMRAQTISKNKMAAVPETSRAE